MSALIVFGGHNSLDFSAVRLGVLRIPEVSLKVEEAQRAWDRFCRSPFSIQHFLSSEDSTFFNNINLKTLALSVVQLGLFDRYQRTFGTPDIVVGSADPDSPLRVVTGECSLSELVSRSPACGVSRPLAPLQLASELVLNGRALPQFEAVRIESLVKIGSSRSVGEATGEATAERQVADVDHITKAIRAHLPTVRATRLGGKEMNLSKLLHSMIEKENVSRLVHVGPGAMGNSESLSRLSRDIQVVESIDADPMLGWFWQDMRKSYDAKIEAAQ